MVQIVPAYFLWLRHDLFIQHRTFIISVLHVAHMISGDLFGSFWPAKADFSQPLQFYTMAFVSAGNMLNLLFWYNPICLSHQPQALRCDLESVNIEYFEQAVFQGPTYVGYILTK